MSFSDDEQQIVTQDASAKIRIINKSEAPLEACKLKVLLEVKGSAGVGKERMGVDLVTILDVSESMGVGKKLAILRWAMQSLIMRLSPVDRLSVVTYSGDSERLCPLSQITEKSQAEIGELVNGLVAGGPKNMGAGLETGLQVLNGRKLSSGRVAAIMLLSDGANNRGPDPAKVPLGNVPIYTFGFGAYQDPVVLKSIADKSNGGTFSAVQDLDKLSIAFLACLAGILTVAVQDLKLTVTVPQEPIRIQDVSAGNYPKSTVVNDAASGPGGSVMAATTTTTVWFGDLYDKEVRRVMVDILLPAVDVGTPGMDVLQVSYGYSAGGEELDGPPVFATVTRTAGTTMEGEREEVQDEVNRCRTADLMKAARLMADDKNLGGAEGKLLDAYNKLVLLEDEKRNPLIEMLRTELEMLLSIMESEEEYNKHGRPFALSSESSHSRQRFAARGGAIQLLRFPLFATPRMDDFFRHAVPFVESQSWPLAESLAKASMSPSTSPPSSPSENCCCSSDEIVDGVDVIMESVPRKILGFGRGKT